MAGTTVSLVVPYFVVLGSIHFYFSLFSFSNRLQYNNMWGWAGQGITGPTLAGESTRGRTGGDGKREEEVDGWAGGLKRGEVEEGNGGNRILRQGGHRSKTGDFTHGRRHCVR